MEKVSSSTIQANINLYMFRAEFVVKIFFFLTSARFLILATFFPAISSAGNEFYVVSSV